MLCKMQHRGSVDAFSVVQRLPAICSDDMFHCMLVVINIANMLHAQKSMLWFFFFFNVNMYHR